MQDATGRRVMLDAAICGGKPCISGTRILVRNILGMFAGGYTVERIVQAYPELSREDVEAAMEYAARFVDEAKVTLSR